MPDVIRIEGLSELYAAARATDVALTVDLKDGLLEVASIVATETQSLMGGSDIDFGGVTIAGVRARVASDGSAWAQQQARKSRDMSARRSNFGALQMTRAFLPAVDNKQGEIEETTERVVQEIVTKYFSE